MARIIEAFKQFFDDSGNPLVNGWLKFTLSGTNNTDKDTYADVSQLVQNANPLQLDAAGRCPNVFGSGSYRVVSFTNDTILQQPGVQVQQFDPVGDVTGVGFFEEWIAESVYSTGSIVSGSDGLYYRSLITNNQANDPTVDTSSWEQVELLQYWNANANYSQYEMVRTSTGEIFVSNVDNNAGNAPDISPTEWRSILIRTWGATKVFDQYEVCKTLEGSLWKSLKENNLNNNPLTDNTINWKPVAYPPAVLTLVAGNAFQLNTQYFVTSTNTWYLPLSNTGRTGDWVEVILPEKYRTVIPTIEVQGSDVIRFNVQNDTSFVMDADVPVRALFRIAATSVWDISI